MVNDKAFEVPPPGAGVTTVTGTLPGVTMSLAGIAAVTWPALTNVVVRATPFQRTSEVPTKLLPFTVSVKRGPPGRRARRGERRERRHRVRRRADGERQGVRGPPAGRRSHHRHRRAPLR